MHVGIMGTGNVAQTLAKGLTAGGHSVTLGSRHPDSRTDLSYPVASLEDTARDADVIVNATPGDSSEEVLGQVDPALFSGKLLIDLANAATSSNTLIHPDSSLGERLQAMLPEAKVVKSLNTMAGKVFINPSSVGSSSVFVSGDDAGAKSEAVGLLKDMGWPEDSIVDLGGISTAKGPEHYFIMWSILTEAFGDTGLNINVVR